MVTDDSDKAQTPAPRKRAFKTSNLIVAGALVLAIGWVIALDRYAGGDPDIAGAEQSETSQPTAESQSRSAPSPSAIGPWENAELAEQREETLAVIQDLQKRKAALDALSPGMWTKDGLANIAALTAQGDDAYKTGDFAGAREIFSQALRATDAEIDRAPSVASDAKAAGHDALDAGDLQGAIEAYSLAAAIDPSDPEAKAGLTSASVRDEVDAMMVRGAFALKTGDFDAARAQFKLAAQLDPADSRPGEALARTNRTEKSSRIATLTRQGYEAIESGKFSQAIERFSAALVLAPKSTSARDGLKLAERRRLNHRLDTQEAKGKAAEAGEDWQAAIDSYQAALKLDASSAFALSGLDRASGYLAMARELDGYIAQPFRLTSSAVAASANGFVQEMARMANLPPGLSAKRDDVERLLNQMTAVVNVTISSDGQSDVTVQRYEKLGKFKNRTIELKYGKYVLTARRIGYVDKRLELEIPVGSQPLSVTLYCDERI